MDYLLSPKLEFCAIGKSSISRSRFTCAQTDYFNPLTHKVKLALEQLYGNLQTAWTHLKHWLPEELSISDIEVLLDFLKINSTENDLKSLLGPNFKKTISFDSFQKLFVSEEFKGQGLLITETDTNKNSQAIIKLITHLKGKFENIREMSTSIFGSHMFLSIHEFFKVCEVLHIDFDMIEKTELQNLLDPGELGIVEKDLLMILFKKYESSEEAVHLNPIDEEFKEKIKKMFPNFESAFIWATSGRKINYFQLQNLFDYLGIPYNEYTLKTFLKRHSSTGNLKIQDLKKIWEGSGLCSRSHCRSPAKQFTDYCNIHSRNFSERGKMAIGKLLKESDHMKSKKIVKSLDKLKIKSGFKLSVGELKCNLSPFFRSKADLCAHDWKGIIEYLKTSRNASPKRILMKPIDKRHHSLTPIPKAGGFHPSPIKQNKSQIAEGTLLSISVNASVSN
ncbi:unnamed protein product [Blepharisma stoltei]|uniref:Uncharacterized protein n=1 Tax=Blepharisma stoltei TaxID=1481888 RepID=A0AAU9IQF5_9CILI|nr:unnamed protein product [Blepharisma stoltei]